jgi:hypothetical protein
MLTLISRKPLNIADNAKHKGILKEDGVYWSTDGINWNPVGTAQEEGYIDYGPNTFPATSRRYRTVFNLSTAPEKLSAGSLKNFRIRIQRYDDGRETNPDQLYDEVGVYYKKN